MTLLKSIPGSRTKILLPLDVVCQRQFSKSLSLNSIFLTFCVRQHNFSQANAISWGNMVGESSTPEGGSSPGGPPQKRVFKIIVVGDSGVGKTCLTYRFCEGRFPGRTEATIGVDFREKTFMVDDETIKV